MKTYIDQLLIPVVVKNLEQLELALPRIVGLLEASGVALIQAWLSHDRCRRGDAFRYLSCRLGHLQDFPAAHFGITLVEDNPSDSGKMQKSLDHSCLSSFRLHTDGYYLSGLIRSGDQMRSIEPPGMVLLECEEQVGSDNNSLIVDTAAVYQHLLRSQPDMLSMLSQPCVTFIGADQNAINFPIFEKLPDNSIRVRYGAGCVAASSAIPAVRRFQQMLEDHTFRLEFRLESGQILVCDNRRVLHARHYPTASRRWRRIWLMDHAASVYHPLGEDNHCQLTSFARFGELSDLIPNAPGVSVKLGIHPHNCN